MIHRIMAEEEITSVHTLAIVLNCRESSDLYQQIYATENILSALTVEYPERVEADDGKAARKFTLRSRRSSTTKVFNDQFGVQTSKEKKGDEFPNKDQFLHRFKFSREYLDLGEICLGMNNQNIEN